MGLIGWGGTFLWWTRPIQQSKPAPSVMRCSISRDKSAPLLLGGHADAGRLSETIADRAHGLAYPGTRRKFNSSAPFLLFAKEDLITTPEQTNVDVEIESYAFIAP